MDIGAAGTSGNELLGGVGDYAFADGEIGEAGARQTGSNVADGPRGDGRDVHVDDRRDEKTSKIGVSDDGSESLCGRVLVAYVLDVGERHLQRASVEGDAESGQGRVEDEVRKQDFRHALAGRALEEESVVESARAAERTVGNGESV